MTEISGIGQTTASAPAQKRDPKLWSAAQQFENVLVEQLAKQLEATAQPDAADGADGDDADAQSGAQSFYGDLLPGALADGVTAAGGLGLTQQLYDAMKARTAQ